MKVLLDTHTFLWWITDSPRLSARAREVIHDSDNELFFSAASGWEIAIKAQLGRLQLPDNLEQFIVEQLALNAILVLPIQLRHALHVYTLPQHHRDPFDRMLVAQSQVENLSLLTADPQITQYEVAIIW
jgi:PIN domain nuclease of toxin-antitoxin system